MESFNDYVMSRIKGVGADHNFWVWEPADYTRDYMVVADVARGDGKDFSTCHVIDIATNVQVAEYRGQLHHHRQWTPYLPR